MITNEASFYNKKNLKRYKKNDLTGDSKSSSTNKIQMSKSNSSDDENNSDSDLISNEKRSKYAKKQKLLLFVEPFSNNRECRSIAMIILSLLVLTCLLFYLPIFSFSNDSATCSGKLRQDEIAKFRLKCAKMANGEIAGNLCMDLCVNRDIKLAHCDTNLMGRSKKNYQFYKNPKSESSLICPESVFESKFVLEQNLGIDEFENLVKNFLESKINDISHVDKLAQRIFYFTDSNHDLKLNYAEAQSLWFMLNSKHTFYMLVFASKIFVPEIKDYCGSLIEIEEVVNSLSTNEPSIFSMFTRNKWWQIKWEYRAKILLGVLEFFNEASQFNPNDEFGADSLYLCSPIDESFGYNYFYDAKLIDYEEILSGNELKKKLASVKCASDLDCFYSSGCTAKCLKNECSEYLSRPQLVDFCSFINRFLQDEPSVLSKLKSTIDKCLKLETIFLEDRSILYDKNDLPIKYDDILKHLERENYWNKSIEYSSVAEELRAHLWAMVKFVEEPKKKTNKKNSFS